MTQRYQPRMGWILLLGLTAGSLAEIGWDPALLGERGGRFFDIARAMLPPDWGFFREAAGPLLSTVRMSLAGSFLGSSLGLLGAVLDQSPWLDPDPFPVCHPAAADSAGLDPGSFVHLPGGTGEPGRYFSPDPQYLWGDDPAGI